jgi:hypothetical protein
LFGLLQGANLDALRGKAFKASVPERQFNFGSTKRYTISPLLLGW